MLRASCRQKEAQEANVQEEGNPFLLHASLAEPIVEPAGKAELGFVESQPSILRQRVEP